MDLLYWALVLVQTECKIVDDFKQFKTVKFTLYTVIAISQIVQNCQFCFSLKNITFGKVRKTEINKTCFCSKN